MITVTSPTSPSRDADRPRVSLPVDDATVLLGLLALLSPNTPGAEDDAVQALAERLRSRLSAAIAAAVESPKAHHYA